MTTPVEAAPLEGKQTSQVSLQFERRLAIALLLCSGIYYLSLPISLYRLIGVFNTDFAGPWLAALVTVLGLMWGVLYGVIYSNPSVKWAIFIIVMFFILALPGAIFLLIFPFLIEILLFVAGSVPILLFLAALTVIWLLQTNNQRRLILFLLRTFTLLVALSVPLNFVYEWVFQSDLTIESELHFNDHHYYLASEHRSSGNSSTRFVVLFECDKRALNCRDVEETEIDRFVEWEVFTLAADERDGLVSAYRGGLQLPIISYRPGSGEALYRVFLGIER